MDIRVSFSSEESQFLEILKTLPAGQSIDDESLTDALSIGEPAIFGLAADILSKGEPLCFTSLTGWHDSAVRESENYWLAQDGRDLDAMGDMVEHQLAFLQSLLSGIEVAKRRMGVP